jgi:Methyltransferase domain
LTTHGDLPMAISLLAHRLYCGLMGPAAGWSRKRRMQQMARRMALDQGTKVLDLGGQPAIWRDAPGALCITVLNLPGTEMTPEPGAHEFSYVEGDACHVQDVRDNSYDMVFSNSVIEHVGGDEQQAAFAHEVRRLGRSYWVQTPAIWFPIEAHTGMPFWWFYPEPMRARILRHWHDTLPEWADSVSDTRVLTRQRLQALFPEAQIYVEAVLGVPKSYTAWYVAPPQGGRPAH